MSANKPFDGDWIAPDWPAPARVRAISTTRSGGVSLGAWCGLNLGNHVQDQPAHVAANRQRLTASVGYPLRWLQQVHGCAVVDAHQTAGDYPADASFALQAGVACAVMTADCLPVLLARTDGSAVAAAHAGWRGLHGGVLERSVAALAPNGETVLAWLGPAIGPTAFEVGDDVRSAFIAADATATCAFNPGLTTGKWWADLYLLARQRLQGAGVSAIYGGEHCTASDARRFYSYRRDGQTGRMASVIWLVD